MQFKRFLTAGALLFLGCQRPRDLSIVPGSTVVDLRISVSQSIFHLAGPLGVLVVQTCDTWARGVHEFYWEIEGKESVREVHYGSVPPGYTEVAPARSLEPSGCFVAFDGAAAGLFFVSDSIGRIGAVTESVARRMTGR